MAKGESKIHFDLQRRVVSHMTSSSWRTVPHVSFVYEPDVTDFIKVYQKLSTIAAGQEYKLTLNTVILKIISEGLKKAPSLNAFIDYDPHKGEGSLITKNDINLLPDGRMITPTILDCGNKSMRQISNDITEIKRKISNTDIDELLFSTIRNDTLNEIRKFNVGIIRRIVAAKITKRPVKGLRSA